jgi:hypothetical protein
VQKQKSGDLFSTGHAIGASGGWADSFVQFPLEKGLRKVYNYSTKVQLNKRVSCKLSFAQQSLTLGFLLLRSLKPKVSRIFLMSTGGIEPPTLAL